MVGQNICVAVATTTGTSIFGSSTTTRTTTSFNNASTRTTSTTTTSIINTSTRTTTSTLSATTIAKCSKTDKVKSGEGCYQFAMRNGISDYTKLYSFNPGLNCNILYVDQVICLNWLIFLSQQFQTLQIVAIFPRIYKISQFFFK